jgi:tRNA(Ile)-lysidine synthase
LKCILSNIYHFSVGIAHYNHNVRGEEALLDEEFVKEIAYKFRVPIVLSHYTGNKKDEASLREARYNFFSKLLKLCKNSYIAMAHNLDDVAETFLYRLFRYGGGLGLGGIFPKLGDYIRPLLPIKKQEILEVLKKNRIHYRIDSSNYDITYKRNYIRHNIMPLVAEISSTYRDNIFLAVKELWDLQEEISYIEKNLRDRGYIKEFFGGILVEKKVLDFFPLTLLVRLLIKKFDLERIYRDIFYQIKRAFLKSISITIDDKILVSSTKRYVFLVKNDFLDEKKAFKVLDINLGKNTIFGFSFFVERIKVSGDNDIMHFISLAKVQSDKILYIGIDDDKDINILKFSFRKDGDKIKLGNGYVSLKKVFQKFYVPSFIRDFIPIIRADNGEVIAICFPFVFSNLRFILSSDYYLSPSTRQIIKVYLG